MNPAYYVATYSGFLVAEDMWAYTVPDLRIATRFRSFLAADNAAKWAVRKLFPPDVEYFALLHDAYAGDEAHAPFYLATYGGFAVIEPVQGGRTRIYTVVNPRHASVFETVDEAEQAALTVTETLFPPERRSYAVLAVSHA